MLSEERGDKTQNSGERNQCVDCRRAGACDQWASRMSDRGASYDCERHRSNGAPTARPAPPILGMKTVDPVTGRSISLIIAAALCVKPRGLLTVNQAVKVDAPKSEWPEFAAMRRLAMRF